MAIVGIKKFNEAVLRRKCARVEIIDGGVKDVVADMAQTLERENGLGLAAPQIGVSKRIIIARAGFDSGRILVLINPKILSKSKETVEIEEGCLSFPGIFLEIKRSERVEVEGINIDGKKIRFSADGILARVFQHEIDHLDGILFFSRLAFFKKMKFLLKHPSLNL
jgi:peptide deformylase